MPNIVDIFSNTNSVLILYLLSFLGGIIASVSPCSIAMLPIIIGYIGGYSEARPSKTLIQMVFFVIGTAIVFSIIGLICAITGKVFVAFAGGYFGLIMASIIMIMGLKLTGFLDFELPVFIKEIPKNEGADNFLYPMILGAVVALAGTPCSTPILASIMAFASLSTSLVQSIIMLFLFSLGEGLILIFAGVVTAKIKSLNGFYKFSDLLLKICGLLLIGASIFIFYKIFYPLLVK